MLSPREQAESNAKRFAFKLCKKCGATTICSCSPEEVHGISGQPPQAHITEHRFKRFLLLAREYDVPDQFAMLINSFDTKDDAYDAAMAFKAGKEGYRLMVLDRVVAGVVGDAKLNWRVQPEDVKAKD